MFTRDTKAQEKKPKKKKTKQTPSEREKHTQEEEEEDARAQRERERERERRGCSLLRTQRLQNNTKPTKIQKNPPKYEFFQRENGNVCVSMWLIGNPEEPYPVQRHWLVG